MKRVVNTDLAPKAIGPYSQAIRCGNFLFMSGQLPVDPKTGEFAAGDDEVVAQAHQSMTNIKNILESEDMNFDNVVKTTVFLSDINNFAKVNEVYQEYFGQTFPARSCIEVGNLPKEALVEIEVIAYK
ncbi:RidA family protein [Clostridium ganghwense]|uniref:RidA family protein n=1 Tax=Clostridium ganghwense TaxID=312089 RepID=A0ABT4CUG8_9CLOT|nr:RidA family protein [Clostridium ganghwense]MCY6372720.1 RidA family protein [Clostridium ganghwense]